MAILLKIAKSHKEIDDALWVRHQVLVIEDGKFGGKPLPNERLIDRFDVFPGVYNIITYDGQKPIATMRLTKENVFGVPADEHYDFGEFREKAYKELLDKQRQFSAVLKDPVVLLGSAGMLAVRDQWRVRRDVIRAMFKMAAGVCYSSGATHVVGIVNHDTASMYRRLGFTLLSDKIWIEDIGNYVVPIATSADEFYDWAFGDLPATPLDIFKDSFERLFLRAGEKIFRENEFGEHAYLIDSGHVLISRRSPDGPELTLAHLERGDLFGELALIDSKPRSANATALTDVELITLQRKAFMAELTNHPNRIQDVLEIFTKRIRRMDELALILAFAPAQERLQFALKSVRDRAAPAGKDSGERIASGGPADLARSAGVEETEAERFLDECRDRGELQYSNKEIRFFH